MRMTVTARHTPPTFQIYISFDFQSPLQPAQYHSHLSNTTLANPHTSLLPTKKAKMESLLSSFDARGWFVPYLYDSRDDFVKSEWTGGEFIGRACWFLRVDCLLLSVSGLLTPRFLWGAVFVLLLLWILVCWSLTKTPACPLPSKIFLGGIHLLCGPSIIQFNAVFFNKQMLLLRHVAAILETRARGPHEEAEAVGLLGREIRPETISTWVRVLHPIVFAFP